MLRELFIDKWREYSGENFFARFLRTCQTAWRAYWYIKDTERIKNFFTKELTREMEKSENSRNKIEFELKLKGLIHDLEGIERCRKIRFERRKGIGRKPITRQDFKTQEEFENGFIKTQV